MHAPWPVLWLMGPTSSGKTTLGEALVARLRDKGTPAILFDGDEVRGLIGPGQGFSPEDRLQTVRALVHLANKISDAALVDRLEFFCKGFAKRWCEPGLKIDRERAGIDPSQALRPIF